MFRPHASLWSLLLGLSLLSHCSKQEQVPTAEASAPAARQDPPPSASAEAAPAPAPVQSAAPAASAPAGEPGACGEEGQPDCPLQAFMKREVKPALKGREFDKLAAALEKVSKVPPQGYGEWTKLALAGVAAANKQDEAASKQACKACHDKYEDKFKAEHRTDQLP